ncbi:MAG: FkbM family methyltransferase [Crocinitomicaceae bacterium]|nr:FkbM family methyltransferase [Crocinitomicaceae bacterium]
MVFFAKFFKLLFKITSFRKHYYGLYKRVFKPFSLFKGLVITSSYDNDLKIKLNIDDCIQQQIYFLDFYDKRGINFLKKHLKKGDGFIDIGANIGSYSLIASKLVGEHGKVHAFEPIEDVYNRLLFNVQLYDLENVTTCKKAIYETKDLLKFFVSSHENLGMSSIFHHDTESGHMERVEAISLDEYVSALNIEKINLIKIDIEGAELFALKGMQNTIKKFRPIIVMEISEDVLQNSSIKSTDVIDFMEEFDYSRCAINQNGEQIDISHDHQNNYYNYAFYPLNTTAKIEVTSDFSSSENTIRNPEYPAKEQNG